MPYHAKVIYCLFIYRFILRVLPIEVACYASEEEISRAIAPVVEKYFPVDTQDPQKVPRSINFVDP
jgi:hypothetical protein